MQALQFKGQLIQVMTATMRTGHIGMKILKKMEATTHVRSLFSKDISVKTSVSISAYVLKNVKSSVV